MAGKTNSVLGGRAKVSGDGAHGVTLRARLVEVAGRFEAWANLVDTTPKRKEEFLMDLANLHPHPGAAERFFTRHHHFFVVWNYEPQAAYHLVLKKLDGLAAAVRRAWDEQRPTWRDWYGYELRRIFHHEIATVLAPQVAQRPPMDLVFDNAARYLQENIERARHCQNPSCAAPYFFAPSRRPRKFCDEDCARPSELASKRRWWDKTKGK